MSRLPIVIAGIAAVAAVCSATSVLIVNGTEKDSSGMSDEQIETRRKLIGPLDEHPRISKSQQMRPRW